jgi:hypothetical protein
MAANLLPAYRDFIPSVYFRLFEKERRANDIKGDALTGGFIQHLGDFTGHCDRKGIGQINFLKHQNRQKLSEAIEIWLADVFHKPIRCLT